MANDCGELSKLVHLALQGQRDIELQIRITQQYGATNSFYETIVLALVVRPGGVYSPALSVSLIRPVEAAAELDLALRNLAGVIAIFYDLGVHSPACTSGQVHQGEYEDEVIHAHGSGPLTLSLGRRTSILSSALHLRAWSR
jgi:hypothetical protein